MKYLKLYFLLFDLDQKDLLIGKKVADLKLCPNQNNQKLQVAQLQLCVKKRDFIIEKQLPR